MLPTDAVPTAAPTKTPTPIPEPEGMIAFSQGYLSQIDALKIYDLSDGNVWQVTEDLDVPIWEISWSPDGKRLAFTSGIMGFELYTVNADGSGLSLLGEGGVSNFYAPLWSPNGGQVMAMKTNFFDEYRILTVNVDGLGEEASFDLPITTQTELMHFKWSPDGSLLAFTAFDEAEGVYGLYTLNGDGSGMRVLATSEVLIKVPDWSPDGTRIVYEAGNDIFDVQADGSALTQLTAENGINSFPVWAPDGSSIAFYSDRSGDGQRLYQMRPDGTDQTMVLDLRTTGEAINDLKWSPDGAFITVRAGYGLLIVDMDTGDIVGEVEDVFVVAWKP
jgi:Tol biopolymer transport system component